MIILAYFFLFLQKSIICCGYSLEVPHGTSNEYPQHMLFMENWRKLSQNYHQIFLLNSSSYVNFIMYHLYHIYLNYSG